MKRVFLVFAVLVGFIGSSARAQDVETWCYVFDFKVSNYGAYNVLSGEWVYGDGLSLNSELEFHLDAGFLVGATAFDIVFSTSETEASVLIYEMYIFGSDFFTSPLNIHNGTTTIHIAATGDYNIFYFFGGSAGVPAWLESLTVYGDGESPFGRNDCATETTDPAYVYGTLESGQTTRFDYVATAADVHQSSLMTWILYSMWGMFLFWFFDKARGRKK